MGPGFPPPIRYAVAMFRPDLVHAFLALGEEEDPGLLESIRTHPGLVTALGIFSVVGFVASLILLPWGIARIPDDYFARRRAPRPAWHDAHRIIYWMIKVGKNLIGALLILAGVAMLVLPGQGILAILLGLMMLEFPGKRGLELWLMRRKRVAQAMNWIRAKAGRSPLEVYRPRRKEKEDEC